MIVTERGNTHDGGYGRGDDGRSRGGYDGVRGDPGMIQERAGMMYGGGSTMIGGSRSFLADEPAGAPMMGDRMAERGVPMMRPERVGSMAQQEHMSSHMMTERGSQRSGPDVMARNSGMMGQNSGKMTPSPRMMTPSPNMMTPSPSMMTSSPSTMPPSSNSMAPSPRDGMTMHHSRGSNMMGDSGPSMRGTAPTMRSQSSDRSAPPKGRTMSMPEAYNPTDAAHEAPVGRGMMEHEQHQRVGGSVPSGRMPYGNMQMQQQWSGAMRNQHGMMTNSPMSQDASQQLMGQQQMGYGSSGGPNPMGGYSNKMGGPQYPHQGMTGKQSYHVPQQQEEMAGQMYGMNENIARSVREVGSFAGKRDWSAGLPPNRDQPPQMEAPNHHGDMHNDKSLNWGEQAGHEGSIKRRKGPDWTPESTRPNVPLLLPTDQDIETQKGLMNGITSANLMDHALATHLTLMVRSDKQDTLIRVVGDTMKRSLENANMPAFSYRSRAIFALKVLPDSQEEVFIFGMYVREFGNDAPPMNRGRVHIEAIDSTALYAGELPEERHDILTSIVVGYLDYSRLHGFEYVHIRVPPPTDATAHIFASRALNVRLKAQFHLSNWYKRILRGAVSCGIIHDLSFSDSLANVSKSGFPYSLLSARDVATERAFVLAGNLNGSGPPVDRFFTATLQTPGNVLPFMEDRTPCLPPVIASNRKDLSEFIAREMLFFHMPPHAILSTMVLIKVIYDGQQAYLNKQWNRQSGAKYMAQPSAPTPPQMMYAPPVDHQQQHDHYPQAEYYPGPLSDMHPVQPDAGTRNRLYESMQNKSMSELPKAEQQHTKRQPYASQQQAYAPPAPHQQPYAPPAPHQQPYAPPAPHQQPYAPPSPQQQPYAPSAPQQQPYAPSAPLQQPYAPPAPQQQPHAPPAPQLSVKNETKKKRQTKAAAAAGVAAAAVAAAAASKNISGAQVCTPLPGDESAWGGKMENRQEPDNKRNMANLQMGFAEQQDHMGLMDNNGSLMDDALNQLGTDDDGRGVFGDHGNDIADKFFRDDWIDDSGVGAELGL